jgi:hypothetical protein
MKDPVVDSTALELQHGTAHGVEAVAPANHELRRSQGRHMGSQCEQNSKVLASGLREPDRGKGRWLLRLAPPLQDRRVTAFAKPQVELGEIIGVHQELNRPVTFAHCREPLT